MAFTYDYTHNSVNQYQTISETVWDEPTVYSIVYDDNGNLYDDGHGYIHTYDYRNRLKKIELGPDTIAQYTYDALGRRIAKTVGDVTTLFYYNPAQQVIAEYELVEDTPQLTREYVYGNGVSEILCMFYPQYDVGQADWEEFLGFCEAWLSDDAEYDHNSDGKVDYKDFAYFAPQWGPFPSNEESHFYYLMDALGSVRGLIGGKFKREEDREFYNYDVYGDSSDSSAAGNPFLFAGYRYDPESNLYFMPYRSYDPVTGRWLQFDPLGYADSMNLYEYAANNPINYIDLDGLLPQLTEKEKQDAIAKAKSRARKFIWGGTGLASDLLKHFRDGSGATYHLSNDNVMRIWDTSEAQTSVANFKSRDLSKAACGTNVQAGTCQNFDQAFPGNKITYSKPGSVWNRSDSADAFYSFHNLYYDVTVKGQLCKNCDGTCTLKDDITYRFHDRYEFQPREWQPIPGDEEATDKIFWIWQTYGDAKAFSIEGRYTEKLNLTFDCKNNSLSSGTSGKKNGY